MDKFRVEYKDNEIIFSDGKQDAGSRSPNNDDFSQFKEWIQTYNHALKQSDNKKILLTMGREIYVWLNGNQYTMDNAVKDADNPFTIEFTIPKRPSDIQKAFIEVPWELLADKTGHLAQDTTLNYSPVRCIGNKQKTSRTPSQFRLNTVFMAASPRNIKPELAYEQEESAILNLHTENALEMDLFVEESGNPDQLARLVDSKKPVDIVHISCHGNIFHDSNNEKNQAYLCLEDFTGNMDSITPNSFCRTFSQNRPALTFLSACKTAEAHLSNKISKKENFDTFTQSIIRHGFPAVLGWSGSVSDAEATRFASGFYRELTKSATLEDAVALSRSLLFSPPENEAKKYESKDWHLARLYLGPDGGGIVSDGNRIRFDYEKDAGIKEFLGKKEQGLEVAGRNEFVGRRRQIQDILKEFLKDNKHAGVLIHGIGNQGKSSLAARVANRMQNQDYETVLIYGKKGEKRLYSARHVFHELGTVNNPAAEAIVGQYADSVNSDPSAFKTALKELLNGPFSGRDDQHKAVLMVIDDLEKILAPPVGDSNIYGVEKDYRPTLIAIISAFKKAKTKSRLLLTSRYDFDLADDLGHDISDRLFKLPLPSMNDTEAQKQYLAKYETVKKIKGTIVLEPDRIVKACKGNPGLQDMMFGLFADSPENYHRALEEMQAYLKGGDLPKEQNVQNFLQDLALDTIFSLLSRREKELLSLAALFDIPVPEPVFDALKEGLIKKGVDYKKRLVGFGLLELYEDFVAPDRKSLQINPIAQSRIETPSQESINTMAGSITDALFSDWCADDNAHRPWICDKEIIKFALIAENAEAVKHCAENCIKGLDNNFLMKEAADLAISSISLLENNKKNVPVGLYQIASDVCHQIGETDIAKDYIEKSLAGIETDGLEAASSYFQLGKILVQKGKLNSAVDYFEKARNIFTESKKERDSAIVSGELARIKVSKGEVDEALKLHQEMIQVFDQLGDTRSKAVTMGDIARIKVDKGEVDEALKLHQDELDVYDQLGDIASRAVTLWDMSKIFLHKDEIQKAYEYLDESYQICQKHGRLDGICYVGLDLGMLLCQADQKEEGLKILERSKDGFQKLRQAAYAHQIQEIINQFES